MSLKVGGHNEGTDWPKLGPSLLIATCLIVAIRTAKRSALPSDHCSDPEMDKEIDMAAYIASRVLSALVSKKPNLFPTRREPWYQPCDEDLMK